VTVVERVIAGVVVAVATVHANQLADTTLALVTVPHEVGAIAFNPVAVQESYTTIYQSVPTACAIGFVQS
jgi:hypothetical protein